MGQCDGNEDGMDLRGNCGIDRRVLSMVEGGALDVRGAGSGGQGSRGTYSGLSGGVMERQHEKRGSPRGAEKAWGS